MDKEDGNMTKTSMKVTLGMGGIYTAYIYEADGLVRCMLEFFNLYRSLG